LKIYGKYETCNSYRLPENSYTYISRLDSFQFLDFDIKYKLK